MLKAAGFVDVEVNVKEESRELIAKWMPGQGAEDVVASAMLLARKPYTGLDEKAEVKAFWDGVLDGDDEDLYDDEPTVAPKKVGGQFDQIRQGLSDSDYAEAEHGHGAPSGHGHGNKMSTSEHGHGASSGHGHGASSGHGHSAPSGHGHSAEDEC
jgi:hypothetical protein